MSQKIIAQGLSSITPEKLHKLQTVVIKCSASDTETFIKHLVTTHLYRQISQLTIENPLKETFKNKKAIFSEIQKFPVLVDLTLYIPLDLKEDLQFLSSTYHSLHIYPYYKKKDEIPKKIIRECLIPFLQKSKASLKKLILREVRCSSAELASCIENDLTSLTFFSALIKDDSEDMLKALGTCPLEHLYIWCDKLGDRVVEPFRQMISLRETGIFCSTISVSVLKALACLENLETIHFSESKDLLEFNRIKYKVS